MLSAREVGLSVRAFLSRAGFWLSALLGVGRGWQLVEQLHHLRLTFPLTQGSSDALEFEIMTLRIPLRFDSYNRYGDLDAARHE